MRTSLLASVALTALLVGCAQSDPVPAIDDVSSSDADDAVSVVARSEVLRDAVEYDEAPKGEGIDFGNAPDEFTLEFDAGEGLAEADGGTALGSGYSNFAAGVLTAAAANLVTTSVILPPAIGIGIVAQGTITEIDTNVWQAVRTIPIGEQDVTGTFTVAFVGVGWLAEMRLTTEDGAWNDDVWFNGFLSLEGAVGWWDLYDHGDLVAVIEWMADGEGNAQIGLAAVAGEHEGASLDYVFVDNGFARIDAVDAYEEHAWVQINPDHSGEVRLPDYNAGEVACWASDFTDTDCI